MRYMGYDYNKIIPVYSCEIIVDKPKLDYLKNMSVNGLISSDHFSIKGDRVIMVLKKPEIDMLRKEGFKIKSEKNMLEQVENVKNEVIESNPLLESTGLMSGYITKYLDAKEIIEKFESLHNEFKDITQIIDLPYKTNGYDGLKANLQGPSTVKLFRINTNVNVEKPKPGMLLISGTHAREWVPPLASIEFSEQLLRSYSPGSDNRTPKKVNEIMEGIDLFIIPAMNPDGINYSHHDDPNWRKNRSNLLDASECKGVDNNRNYSTYWGEVGSSSDKCDDSYRGMSALSEPENKNVTFVLTRFQNIITAIDCHSFGEDIFRPQPTGGIHISSQPVRKEDHDIYLKLESSMNSAISSVSPGKTYATGTTNNHAGTSDDYLYFAHKVFGFCIECVDDTFWPSMDEAIITTKEVSNALRILAEQTILLGKK
jgi:hypothetical protein